MQSSTPILSFIESIKIKNIYFFFIESQTTHEA